ncbi:MAG: TIGR04013 family B12-binding domain/radical SAM domain-containing protein [Planctomycetota bacterium]
MEPAHVVLLLTEFNRNSLAAVAGALEETPPTADCPITVAHGMDNLIERLPDVCGAARRVVVAFSFGTLALTDAAVAMQRLRQMARGRGIDNLVSVAGGPHPSAVPEEALKLGFDYVVVGEGEIAFPSLVSALAREADASHIKGIATTRDGRVIRNGRAEQPDVHAFPPVAQRTRLFSYIEITRGCGRGCKFCQNPFLFGRSLRHRSIENIAAAVQFLHDVGWRDIHFLSPDALSYGSDNPGEPNLRAVSNLLKATNEIAGREHTFFGSFPSEVWPASVTDEAMGLLRAHTGNDMLIIGAQSGSQAVLDRMKRWHTVDDVIRAVQIIVKHGFVPSVDFLFGLPGETEADEGATLDLMLRLADMGAQIHSHTFIPLPGTPLAEFPSPHLSPRLQRALDRLAGPGKQYGAWRQHMQAARRVADFRKELGRVETINAMDLGTF